MKKIVIGILALLLLTGCSNNGSDQTLFVANKKDQYGLVDINGNKKTKFIYDRYEPILKDGYIVVKDDSTRIPSHTIYGWTDRTGYCSICWNLSCVNISNDHLLPFQNEETGWRDIGT